MYLVGISKLFLYKLRTAHGIGIQSTKFVIEIHNFMGGAVETTVFGTNSQ